MKKILVVYGLLIMAIFLVSSCQQKEIESISRKNNVSEYNPAIDPSKFVAKVNNPYYSLKPGKSYTFQSKTQEGTEKNIVTVTNRTNEILGIKAIEVWDRVWLNNELIEETLDWYAQDKEGNVWYFGEDSKKYENGKIVSTKGSWTGGIDGAKPGIIMEAHPKVGDEYRQEYYKGEAEDMADVVALGQRVSVPYGTFKDCLKTRDWSRVESSLNEYKYYCPGIGGFVLEVVVDSGERVELIKVD